MFSTPSVGRIVHFHAHDEAPGFAAIVTRVHDASPEGCLDLEVFHPPGIAVNRVQTSLRHRDNPGRPTDAAFWDFPPRV